jgi:UDP-glucose 4-epimerase
MLTHRLLDDTQPSCGQHSLLFEPAQVALGQREALGVFGDDYDTPDGTGVRDYM